MALLSLLEDLSLHARVATAVLPFLLAIGLRVVTGKSRLAGWLITLSTMWFVANLLVAPYSARMQQDILNLPIFRP